MVLHAFMKYFEQTHSEISHMCLVAVDWVLNMLQVYVYLFSFKRLRDKHHRVLSLRRVHISLSPSFLKWHTYIIPCVFILLNKCFLNSKENHSYFTLSMLIYMLYINCIGYVSWYPCMYGPACVGISYKLLSNDLEYAWETFYAWYHFPGCL